jgi:hypothetical protein
MPASEAKAFLSPRVARVNSCPSRFLASSGAAVRENSFGDRLRGLGVGIFRLRVPIRFALRHAPLKMTAIGTGWGVPQGRLVLNS